MFGKSLSNTIRNANVLQLMLCVITSGSDTSFFGIGYGMVWYGMVMVLIGGFKAVFWRFVA